jgi:hypothetical protein
MNNFQTAEARITSVIYVKKRLFTYGSETTVGKFHV